ncbi:hypothetical protein GLOIN_2v1638241 [Rhizophagus irregularis DAOM 181602=DAOM 197198]|uniref:Uncharacterized protein n=1 Tax=Rhizophagus irregularis (strain DAOM 181602 / DAOM 197198 / MUCL 43194) TaxID=747089 RepID=A0A2P4PSB3_RHIID|nr:hypothetical protein GLOIN_2v1638241 [Rhizophagus irregularis DAOM 181602=DAOM 197198]POG68273.1 hypothetical protein GLOIN_2v1638241 [Rhizophagus irregularis DAOM 181602=DAOM 197198]|eukprot:XP_025175139.1 hypothetical protein GLOIN_2v1638241 [Rhizophagus irregularis DAOM 181602=DAOM 197198]
MHTHFYQKNIYYQFVDEALLDFYLEKLFPIMYLDILLKLKHMFHIFLIVYLDSSNI